MKSNSPVNRRQAIQAIAVSTTMLPMMARSQPVTQARTTQKEARPGRAAPDHSPFVMSF